MRTRSSLSAVAIAIAFGVSGSARADVDPPALVPATPVHTEEQETSPAYQLRVPLDLAALGALTTITITRLYRSGHADCAPLCDSSTLNPLDRLSAGFYDERWQTASDFGLYGVLAGTAAVVFFDEGFFHGLNDATVITESIIAGAAMSSVLTLAANRPRPYLYSEKAPLSARSGPDAAESFLSGHTAVCFAAATSLFITERRLHPDSAAPWIILGVGSAAATYVSIARVMGGNHFISDDLWGALAGVSMGVLFPLLHDSPVRVAPLVDSTHKGVALQETF